MTSALWLLGSIAIILILIYGNTVKHIEHEKKKLKINLFARGFWFGLLTTAPLTFTGFLALIPYYGLKKRLADNETHTEKLRHGMALGVVVGVLANLIQAMINANGGK
jgi:hypothetical protein